MPRYRRDNRAMRPIYESPENNISAKSADHCARISTLQSYHYSAVKLFSKYYIQCDHGTYSDLNVRDGQTDGHCGITAR